MILRNFIGKGFILSLALASVIAVTTKTKGLWYAFYHNSSLSNRDWLRSICVDKLYYNADGAIQKVVQTK